MKCFNCDKEFTPKRSTAKYCSDNCRVKSFLERGKKEKPITVTKLQVLYNSLLDMVGRLDNAKLPDVGLKESQMGSIGTMSNTTRQNLGLDKSVQQHMNEIADLQFEEEFRRKGMEIESATNLTRKQKDLLISNMNAPKL